MPNAGYITLAYAVTRIVLIGYLVRLLRLGRRAAGRNANVSDQGGVTP
jgi:hypothetical protein